MAEIVNLRQVRKRKARADKEADAEQNRVAHGLSKTERRKTKDARSRAEQRLDGKHLEREP